MEDVIDRLNRETATRSNSKFITDKLRWWVYGLFFISFVFKFMHWPGAGIGMVLSGGFAALLIIGGIIEGAIRKHMSKAFLDAMINFALIYAVFRLQYWPGGMAMIIMMGLFFLIGFAMHRADGGKLNRKIAIILVIMASSFGLSAIAPSGVFYGTGLTKTFHSYSHNHAFMAWERYAFLLSYEGKMKAANQAIEQAISIAIKDGFESEVPRLQKSQVIMQIQYQ